MVTGKVVSLGIEQKFRLSTQTDRQTRLENQIRKLSLARFDN